MTGANLGQGVELLGRFFFFFFLPCFFVSSFAFCLVLLISESFSVLWVHG